MHIYYIYTYYAYIYTHRRNEKYKFLIRLDCLETRNQLLNIKPMNNNNTIVIQIHHEPND